MFQLHVKARPSMSLPAKALRKRSDKVQEVCYASLGLRRRGLQALHGDVMGVNTQMLLSIDQLIGSSNHVFSAPVGIHKANRPCHRPELLRHQDGPLPPELLDGRKKGHTRAASTWVCVKMVCTPNNGGLLFGFPFRPHKGYPQSESKGKMPSGHGTQDGRCSRLPGSAQEVKAMFSFLVLFHLVVSCVLKGSSAGKLGRAQ